MANAKAPTKQSAQRGVGRPATGTTRTKISVTIPTSLVGIAQKFANAKNESFSQYVSRAIQNLTMEG